MRHYLLLALVAILLGAFIGTGGVDLLVDVLFGI